MRQKVKSELISKLVPGGITALSESLEFLKPSQQEMLSEIAQAGVTIKIEHGDADFFVKHKDQVISALWKLVRMQKIFSPQELLAALRNLSEKPEKPTTVIN